MCELKGLVEEVYLLYLKDARQKVTGHSLYTSVKVVKIVFSSQYKRLDACLLKLKIISLLNVIFDCILAFSQYCDVLR